MEHRSNDDGQQVVTSFNVNTLVFGILIASVVSALGYSDGDPLVQWYVPGGILLLSIALGVFRPTKRTVRTPRTQS